MNVIRLAVHSDSNICGWHYTWLKMWLLFYLNHISEQETSTPACYYLDRLKYTHIVTYQLYTRESLLKHESRIPLQERYMCNPIYFPPDSTKFLLLQLIINLLCISSISLIPITIDCWFWLLQVMSNNSTETFTCAKLRI